MMEWLILYGLLSTALNFWQSNIIGELESESTHYKTQYEVISKKCSTDRERERNLTIESATARARSEREETEIMEDGQRHADSLLRDAENPCLNSDFPLGRLLHLREGEERDSLNGVRMRFPSGANR